MDTTRAQQKALDDELVAPENLALDALKLTPFYIAFEITADVPEIYMQEFWVTVSRHHSSLHFKLNGKSHIVNVDNFRDMLKICPKLPGQEFEEPPLEEEILSFIRDLGHTVENKNSKKNNDMYYPRFTKVIVDYFMAKDQAIPRRNKMFWHYARDDFMFTTVRVISKHQDTQVYGAILPQHLTNQAMLESEAYMTYRAYATGEKTPKPKSTKKKADSESSPKTKPTQASKGKRIKTSAKGDKAAKMKQSATKSKGLTVLSEVALSEADQMKLATKRSKKEFHSSHASGSGDGVDIQSKVPDEQQHTVSGTNEGAGDKLKVYGAILPQHLTNQAMLESEAYMTYRAYATGEKTPKPKSTKKKANSESSPKTKPTQASKGKRIKTSANGDKPAKKKQYATKSKGLTVLSEVALTEVEQMKIALERSKIQTHSSHASGSGDGDKPEVLDVSEYRLKSEEESWTFIQGGDDEENDEHDSEDDNDEHDSENDNDDEDDDQENEEEKAEEKVNVDDEVSSDQKVLTPPNYELTEEEENQEDDDVMGGEQEDKEDEELYGDLNLNLDRRDVEMTNTQTNQETKYVHTPSSDTTIPQPPIPIIQSQQQTHNSTTTTTIPTITLPEIPNFASLFGFERRVSSLETELSKLKQTNQFAEALSSIPGIVNNYFASQMKDAVNVAVQLQSNKLREEAQAEND
ncbi:hypothetical protein Tco_1429627 [Tanacetum coccineum]